MKKHSGFVATHLSAFIFIIMYLIMVIIHLVSDTYILENQVSLIIVFLPLILLGAALDYILFSNKDLPRLVRILAQLIPLSIIILQTVNTILLYTEIESLDILNNLIWLFLALPFFISSYHREGIKQRAIPAVIGTIAVMIIYVYLTNQTNNLSNGNGAILYLITFFIVFYTASGIRRLRFISTALGIIVAAVLLLLRYFPVTEAAKATGWDYDILSHFELLLLISLVISIILRILEAVGERKDAQGIAA